jgi:hypothetical protein
MRNIDPRDPKDPDPDPDPDLNPGTNVRKNLERSTKNRKILVRVANPGKNILNMKDEEGKFS